MEMLIGICLGLMIIACIFSFTAMAITIKCYIEVESFKKSTHHVQFMPLEPELSPSKKREFMEGFTPDETASFIL
jgi:hypothetical protein